MDANERVAGLHKAYTDVILNTSHEAAVRILSSERKARRFEYELKVSKEESLRLLLRLKQMMDSKVSEAKLKSITQQKKISELEAQLQEGENIVKNLREELRDAKSKLTQINGQDIAHNVFDKYSSLDLSSIILQRKEPELYRNGFTQRIRACDRNLMDHIPEYKKRVRVITKSKRNSKNKMDLFPHWSNITTKKRSMKRKKRSSNCCLIDVSRFLSRDCVSSKEFEQSLDQSNIEESEISNGIANRGLNDRKFMYTFQRKRKREALIKSNEEKNNLDENLQIAHQLLSLSEGNWWKKTCEF